MQPTVTGGEGDEEDSSTVVAAASVALRQRQKFSFHE
jgi:hypothetical protein